MVEWGLWVCGCGYRSDGRDDGGVDITEGGGALVGRKLWKGLRMYGKEDRRGRRFDEGWSRDARNKVRPKDVEGMNGSAVRRIET